jgi:hypothetical protein
MDEHTTRCSPLSIQTRTVPVPKGQWQGEYEQRREGLRQGSAIAEAPTDIESVYFFKFDGLTDVRSTSFRLYRTNHDMAWSMIPT